jgi:preprotein translocase subunit SecG
MLQTLVLIIHVVACLALIAIVLLQTGRGAEMGAAFGGSSQTLFGSSGGSTFLGKLTTAAAIVFMVTCLGLTYFSSRTETKSVMDKVKVKVEEPQGPVIPDAKPVQGMPSTPTPATSGDKPAASLPAASDQAAPPTESGPAVSQGANPAPTPANPTPPAEKTQ